MSVKTIQVPTVQYPVTIVGNVDDVRSALTLRGQEDNAFVVSKCALVNTTKLSSDLHIVTFATTDATLVRGILSEWVAQGYINLFSQSSGKVGTYYMCKKSVVSQFFNAFSLRLDLVQATGVDHDHLLALRELGGNAPERRGQRVVLADDHRRSAVSGDPLHLIG